MRSGADRLRFAVVLLVIAAGVLGVLAVVLVQPGLPYDEPAHWSNVLFYATHHVLPVVGHPGTTYEAQQGPVAYVLAAAVEAPTKAAFGQRAAFDAVRVVGGVELAGAAWLAWLIVRRFARLPGSLVAVGYLLLAPIFVAISWTAQNDTLALLILLAIIEFSLRRFLGDVMAADGALAGLMLGVGFLTKITVWPLLISLPVWLAWKHRARAMPVIGALGAAFALVTAWWFFRNHHLYGSDLPSSSLPGATFPAYGFHGAGTAGHVLENLITYIWLPTEYYRNLIAAPVILKTVLPLVTVAVLVATPIHAWRSSPGAPSAAPAARDAMRLLVLTGIVAVAGWLYVFVEISAVAPRLAYAALPLWLVLIARSVNAGLTALRGHTQTIAPAVLVVSLLALDAWVLSAASSLPVEPFTIRFGHKPAEQGRSLRTRPISSSQMTERSGVTSVSKSSSFSSVSRLTRSGRRDSRDSIRASSSVSPTISASASVPRSSVALGLP